MVILDKIHKAVEPLLVIITDSKYNFSIRTRVYIRVNRQKLLTLVRKIISFWYQKLANLTVKSFPLIASRPILICIEAKFIILLNNLFDRTTTCKVKPFFSQKFCMAFLQENKTSDK